MEGGPMGQGNNRDWQRDWIDFSRVFAYDRGSERRRNQGGVMDITVIIKAEDTEFNEERTRATLTDHDLLVRDAEGIIEDNHAQKEVTFTVDDDARTITFQSTSSVLQDIYFHVSDIPEYRIVGGTILTRQEDFDV